MDVQPVSAPHHFGQFAAGVGQVLVTALIAVTGLFVVFGLERQSADGTLPDKGQTSQAEAPMPFRLAVTSEPQETRFVFLVSSEQEQARLETALRSEGYVRQLVAESAREAVVVVAASEDVAEAVRQDAALEQPGGGPPMDIVDLR